MKNLFTKAAKIAVVCTLVFALSLNMTAFAHPGKGPEKKNNAKTQVLTETQQEIDVTVEISTNGKWSDTSNKKIKADTKPQGKVSEKAKTDKKTTINDLRVRNNTESAVEYTLTVKNAEKGPKAGKVAEWNVVTAEGAVAISEFKGVVEAGQASQVFALETAMKDVKSIEIEVTAEPVQVTPSPYYAINTDTDIVVDEEGKTIVLNSDQQDYLASVNGQKVTFQNVTLTGTTEAVMLGQYRSPSYCTFNNELNNVNIVDLVVTNGVYNGKDTVANGVYAYGNTVLNNCNMHGTTTTAEGFNTYDIGFVNKSVATINGGSYGAVYVWSQAHVNIYGAEIEKIDCAAITTRNLGMLTIGSGTHVGTINLTTGGWTQYQPALTIEEGAVVDQIVFRGKTYTQKQWTSPFRDKYISVIGDSISTYTGWSDVNPITDPSCTNRYGEAYYGPVGGDFHNTELLVTDTWWHQAATELGAEILISNAGNSTGVFSASYPANAAWDLYLKEMLTWKSRPYYLGTEEHDPDIIAVYIGSNEIARCKAAEFGSVDDIDFETLIVKNSDGSYTYATPATVAEAYSIMLHKMQVTYPKAEIYCITPVPSAGGYLSTVNKRLPTAIIFKDMLEGISAHFGTTVVDIFDEFGIDPECDGVATQEDFDFFHSCFNNDPHPNAAGFDVITKRFVETVLENSKYNK